MNETGKLDGASQGTTTLDARSHLDVSWHTDVVISFSVFSRRPLAGLLGKQEDAAMTDTVDAPVNDQQCNDELHELSLDELDCVAGGRSAFGVLKHLPFR